MNIFEQRKALYQARTNLNTQICLTNQKVKQALLDVIKESPDQALTAYELSLATGMDSHDIADLLVFHRYPKKTHVVKKYALIRPDGSIDMDHTTTREYKACLYTTEDTDQADQWESFWDSVKEVYERKGGRKEDE